MTHRQPTGRVLEPVAEIAKRYGLPVLAFAGSLGENYQVVYELGVDAVAALPASPVTLTFAMENASHLLSDAAERACRFMQVGARIKEM